MAGAVQYATQNPVQIAYVNQDYTGDEPKQDALTAGIELVVVKLPEPEAKRGSVLLPKRWVVEHSVPLTSRFCRLAHGFEQLPETFRRLHIISRTYL